MKRRYETRQEFDDDVFSTTVEFPITVNGTEVRAGLGAPMRYLAAGAGEPLKTPDHRAEE